MKPLPRGFYKEFRELRQSYGKTEYDVDALLEKALPIFEKYVGTDAGQQLELDALRGILDGIEARENRPDPKQGELPIFSHDAHMPLGGGKRIARGHATFDHVFRRKALIDDTHKHETAAWAIESDWTNQRLAALRRLPPSTVVSDVLNEDGSKKEPK